MQRSSSEAARDLDSVRYCTWDEVMRDCVGRYPAVTFLFIKRAKA